MCSVLESGRQIVFTLLDVAYTSIVGIRRAPRCSIESADIAFHGRLPRVNTRKWWPRVYRDASERYVQGHHCAWGPRPYAFSPPQRGHVPASTNCGTEGFGSLAVWSPFSAPTHSAPSRSSTFARYFSQLFPRKCCEHAFHKSGLGGSPDVRDHLALSTDGYQGLKYIF